MTEQKLLKRKKKAQLEGNRNLLASVCVDLAEFYYEKQLYESAIHEYTIASDIYKNQVGKELDYATINRRIGEAFVYLKEYAKALDCQQIYLNVAKEQGDKLEEQRALATMGHTYLTRYSDDDTDKDSLDLAYRMFIKSFVICEELENVVNKYEHKDMMARLLGNLGVVLESLGNYDEGINLLLRSISICKSHDLYEQLQRSHTCLASLYCSKGDYNNAIEQYNTAMEVAGRLKNKIELKYECLKNKADILIKLADFHGAKVVLLKAYKLNSFSVDREDIAQKLKVVAAVCYAEDSLLTTSDLDYKKKKHLYEKLGDGACILNNFPIAIEHYKKMLKAAINNGESGLDLSPCYISLAETYRDNKQFDLAIKNYRKDYEAANGNSKEKIKTLLNIADCMEAAEKDIIDIESIYDEARVQSIVLGDLNMQNRVIIRQAAMLRTRGRFSQASHLEAGVKDTQKETLSDSEPMNEELTTNIGDDISIKDITDVSSDSDADTTDINKPRTSRRRSKGFTIKKNAKGETQLHTACIAGNVELVKRLLGQGHVVNVRDNCGWLPIHEACICGHLEIVQMLIKKGAWINDRGGKLCDGITPLHDAASNGHLEVIQLLLDKGASAIAKTNSGEMPLNMLHKWYEENSLNLESSNLYSMVTSRLMKDMEKLGQSCDSLSISKNCNALVSEQTVNIVSPAKSNKLVEKNKNVVGKLRRNISCDIDLDNNKNISDDSELSNEAVTTHDLVISSNSYSLREAQDEYKRAIENLRHPLREGNSEKKRKSTESFRSALLAPGEVDVDDWLENDMPLKTKKRKSATSPTKRHSSESLKRHNSSSSIKSNKTDYDSFDELFETGVSFDEGSNSNFNTQKTNTSKKITQTSLIDQGFTRQRSFSPTSSVSTNSNKSQKIRQHQSKITSFGQSRSPSNSPVKSNHSSSTHHVTNVFNPEPTLSIDVRIDGKLYRVPCLASELYCRTIGWLAEEAADRYSRKECVKPTLELETKNGASLSEDDFLNILFSVGSMQAEEVEARIVKWNLPSLGDRYVEACQSLGIDMMSSVLKILQETSTSLNLPGMGLGHRNVMPLCKAINRQINLHVLNLSDNYMRDNSLQLLCWSLPSLDNLTVLNLSNNELTTQGLKYLSDMFVNSTKVLLPNLISLDLSYNCLGDESLKSLAIISRHLKLQILDLVDIGLSNQVLDIVPNRNVDLHLDYITNINISYNKLDKQDIIRILNWINPQKCEELNISSNNVTEQGLLKDVVHWLVSRGTEALKLKSLNLCRSNVTDMEIRELLRLMPYLSNLKCLDLSYNEYLTSDTLVALLEHSLIVNLVGCENVLHLQNFSEEQHIMNIKEVRLSVNSNQHVQKDTFIRAFKNVHYERLRIDELSDYLKISLVT